MLIKPLRRTEIALAPQKRYGLKPIPNFPCALRVHPWLLTLPFPKTPPVDEDGAQYQQTRYRNDNTSSALTNYASLEYTLAIAEGVDVPGHQLFNCRLSGERFLDHHA